MALSKQKSLNVSDRVSGNGRKQDERIVRTRRRLDAAFVELLHRRAYGNIRVADITKKAGVGRATFYAHYSSKDDLLRSQFERIVAPMLSIHVGDACPVDARGLFMHVKTSPRLFTALISGPGAGGAPRILRGCLEARIRRAFDLRAEDGATGVWTQKETTTRVVASALLTVIECWIENNLASSPQEVQAFFSRLLGGGLGGSADVIRPLACQSARARL